MSRDLEEVRKKKLERAQELVAAAADTLRAKGFETVDTAVREGDVRAEVIDAAAEWHADLIVIGSHGRKGMDRFLLGSVSEFVARHARCSVEIVRLPASP
jgi:nucleotide-binding universal stress UspA family protein